MHHIDVHVRDVGATRRLFDAVMPLIGYAKRSDDDELVSYWKDAVRPAIFFEEDATGGSGMMRLAFAVASTAQVDAVADAARANGARTLEGPGIHPEYGDDYYAVFFEDGDGNKYEVLRAAAESGEGA